MPFLRLGKIAVFACLLVFQFNVFANPLEAYQTFEADFDSDGDIDYLLKLSPEQVEIPYDINLQIERSAQQYLLVKQSDGSFNITLAENPAGDWTLVESDISEINYSSGGELEIAIRVYGEDPQVIIASQDSNGALAAASSVAVSSLSGSLASILDLNSDGIEEVVISGSNLSTLSAGQESLNHEALQNFAPKTWAGQDGAAHAAINVYMPKELGPVPSLSLQYSSNAGNGLLGVGFNLAGVSKIHYCKPTADVSHTVAATAFTDEERLCLDGQYLVQTAGASRFAHDATYMTEISNSSRIRYKNSSSQNTFEIEVKGGGKLIYSHARKHDQNTSKTIAWYLKRAEDEFGNGYDYSYKYATQHQYQPLLERVEYGTITVVLTWEARANKASQSDPSKSTNYNDEYLGHKGGSTTLIRDRLSSINVQRNSQSLRSYDLKYGVNHNGQSQLEKVEVCALNSACESSGFAWFEGQAEFRQAESIGDFASKDSVQKAQFLDVNGDGFTDIMYPSSSNYWMVRLGSASGYGENINTGKRIGTGSYAGFATPMKLGLDHIQGLLVATSSVADVSTGEGSALSCVNGENFYIYSTQQEAFDDTNETTLACSKVSGGKLQLTSMLQWYVIHLTFNGDTYTGSTVDKLVQTFGNRLYPVDVNRDGYQDLVVKYEYEMVDYLYRKVGLVDSAYGELLSVYLAGVEETGPATSHIKLSEYLVKDPQIDNDFDGTLNFVDFDNDGILDVEKCSLTTESSACKRYHLDFDFEKHASIKACNADATDPLCDATVDSDDVITATVHSFQQPANKLTKVTTATDSVNGNNINKTIYSPYYYADFNGDGLTDRMALTTSGMVTNFSTGNSSDSYDSVVNTEVSGDPFKVQILDFNGDGLTDVLAEDSVGLNLFQAKRVRAAGSYSRNITYEKIQVFSDEELSGGGGTAPMAMQSTSNTSQAITPTLGSMGNWFVSPIFSNNWGGFNFPGEEFLIGSITVNPITYGSTTLSNIEVWQPPAIQYRNTPFIMDYNGDGISDILFFEDNHLYVSTRHDFDVAGTTMDFSSNNKLHSITDSFSNQTEFTYKNSQLTPNTDYDNVRFPYVNIANTTGVLATMKYGNSQNGYRNTSYDYQGALYHLQGRGFMGYGKRTVTDVEKGITAEKNYKQQFPFAGAVASSESYQTADPTKKLAVSNNTWSQKSLSLFDDQIILPYVNQSWSKSFGLNGIATSYTQINQSFDDFANLITKTTRIGNGSASSINISTGALNTVSEFYVYQHGSVPYYVQSELDNWRLSMAVKSTVSSTQGTDTKTVVTTFIPKGDSHLIETKSDFEGTAQQLDHVYNYDNEGRFLSETLSSSVGIHLLESRTAFLNGNFDHSYLPRTITNAAGHSASVVYDAIWHQPKQQTSVQGLTQAIEYDNWGNVYKTISPDGAISLSLSNTCGASCPSGAYYYSTQLQVHKSQKGFLAPPQTTYFDALGRVLREESKNANGENIFQDYQYDLFGRLTKASLPYKSGSADIKWTTYEDYDLFDRALTITQPNGGSVTQSYTETVVGITTTKEITTVLPDATSSTQTTSQTTNSLGQTTQVVNNQSGLTNTYDYDAFNRLKTANIYEGANLKKTVWASYNIAGSKTQINDPDTGIYNYQYDALGLMRKQSDSRGNEYLYSYDKLNQKTQQSLNGELDATWVYSDAIPGLITQRFKSDFNESYEYDNLHRIKQVNTQLKSLAQRQFKYQYDGAGRMQQNTYPSGFEVAAVYNGLGFLTAYQNPENKHSYWQAQTMDAFGNWVGERLGNDIQTQRDYDPSSGLLNSITATKTTSGDIQNLSYKWDSQGNLHKRSDANLNVSEAFNYDGVNRLLSATTTGLASGDRTLSYAYDALGNMTHKSDLSDTSGMVYGTQAGTGINTGPSRLISVTKGGSVLHNYRYDANGNMTQRGNVNVSYTPANKPSRIWNGTPQVAGFVENSFLYDTDEQRFYQQQKQGFDTTRETYYYGAGYEELFDTDTQSGIKTHKQKAYVGGVMIHSFTQSDALVNATKITDIQYIHHDHLGSTQTITNSTGKVLQSLAFDPFGKTRQSNWDDAVTSSSKNPDWANIALNHTSTGFTGHEMLADFDLIHMGGRLYDPIAGRMMSADPFIQAPHFGQSYNRYSYVWNNPLSMTDPTGYAGMGLLDLRITETYDFSCGDCSGGGTSVTYQTNINIGVNLTPGEPQNYGNPLVDSLVATTGGGSFTSSPTIGGQPTWEPAPMNVNEMLNGNGNVTATGSISITSTSSEVWSPTILTPVPSPATPAPPPPTPVAPDPVVPELSKSEEILSKLGAGAASVGILTNKYHQLQSNGLLLLGDGRIRSSQYFGNQYDSPLYVDAAKQYQQKISALSTGAGILGNTLTTISIVTDSYKYSKGGISPERFLFNTTGNGWALGLAMTGSGFSGGLVGLGFYAAGLAYDYGVKPIARKLAEINNLFERSIIETNMNRKMFYER
jgi:RHS repeat-associated protein